MFTVDMCLKLHNLYWLANALICLDTLPITLCASSLLTYEQYLITLYKINNFIQHTLDTIV